LGVAVQFEVELKFTGEAHVTVPPAAGLATPVTVKVLIANAAVTVQGAVMKPVVNTLVVLGVPPQPLMAEGLMAAGRESPPVNRADGATEYPGFGVAVHVAVAPWLTGFGTHTSVPAPVGVTTVVIA
jgi:hypothetical protein